MKGSTHGRFATEEEKKRGNVIFKDLDVVKGAFNLNLDDKNELIKQIHKDCWVNTIKLIEIEMCFFV